MNIHEYQAKELLRGYGVAVLEGHVAWTPEEAEKAAPKLPGPDLRGEVADPCRRPRRRPLRRTTPAARAACAWPSRPTEAREAAEAMLGKMLVTKQTGEAGRRVSRVYVEAGCDIKRELYLSLLVDRDTGRITIVASTEGGMEIEEVADDTARRRSSAPPSTRPPASPASTPASSPSASASKASRSRRSAKFVAAHVQGLHRARLRHRRDQPAGRDRRRRRRRARRQDELRRQRALPAPRDRGAARRGRGGPEGARGRQVQPQLRRARRQYRLHGQRRRPGDGDHGHHQALWRQPGQLPRRRRRRHQGARHRGVQDHPLRPERRRHPGQHLRRHHALRRDRRGRGRRGARGEPRRAAGGAARRHQRRARQEDPGQVRPADHLAPTIWPTPPRRSSAP